MVLRHAMMRALFLLMRAMFLNISKLLATIMEGIKNTKQTRAEKKSLCTCICGSMPSFEAAFLLSLVRASYGSGVITARVSEMATKVAISLCALQDNKLR